MATVERAVFEAHDEARELRRRMPRLPVRELLGRSREIMASKTGLSVDELVSVIREAFDSIDPERLVYKDVPPALESLSRWGVEMGIVGNTLFWESADTRRLLRRAGISGFFKYMLFSDEVGYSKPDREIFLEFSRLTGVHPGKIIYVGDNVVEDVGGALSSGMLGVLIKRSAEKSIFVHDVKAGVINDMRRLVTLYDELSREMCGERE